MQLVGPSGDVALDRAAWASITASGPFPSLPKELLEDHDSSVERLVKVLRLPEEDIFRSKAEIVSLAYTLQADKIAYSSDDKTLSA